MVEEVKVKGKYSRTAQDHHIRDALQVWKGKERAIQGDQRQNATKERSSWSSRLKHDNAGIQRGEDDE